MSGISCYISAGDCHKQYDYISVLINKIGNGFFFHRRHKGANFLTKEYMDNIAKSDVFIIFGTKGYFSSNAAVDEFNHAMKLNKPILFLKSGDIESLESSDGFAENERVKEAKGLIEIMNGCKRFNLPDKAVFYGEWEDEIINGIKTSLTILQENQINGVVKPNIYLSYANGEFNTINKLQPHIDNFSINSRMQSIDYSKFEKLIENSNLFLAYVTDSYLECEIALKELDCAIDNNKQILCLLNPTLKAFETKTKNMYDEKKRQIQNNLKIIKNYKTLELPFDKMVDEDWESIRNKLKQSINELIETTTIKSRNSFESIQLSGLKFAKTIKNIDNKLSARGIRLTENKIAIISLDGNHSVVDVWDTSKMDLNETQSILSSKLFFKKPTLIAINNNEEVLIVDNEIGCLGIYDKDLNIKERIGVELRDYNDMAVDEDTNDVYLVKCVGETDIKVIDYKNKKVKPIEWNRDPELKAKEFKPRFIKVFKNEIFIVNACSIRFQPDNREIIETTIGESYIYVLDKLTFRLKHLIDFKNYALCQPWGLIVDKDSNIYTTALQLNERKYLSKERFFCKLNKGGDLTECTPLCNCTLPNDIIKANDKLIFLYEDEIIFYN